MPQCSCGRWSVTDPCYGCQVAALLADPATQARIRRESAECREEVDAPRKSVIRLARCACGVRFRVKHHSNRGQCPDCQQRAAQVTWRLGAQVEAQA